MRIYCRLSEENIKELIPKLRDIIQQCGFEDKVSYISSDLYVNVFSDGERKVTLTTDLKSFIEIDGFFALTPMVVVSEYLYDYCCGKVRIPIVYFANNDALKHKDFIVRLLTIEDIKRNAEEIEVYDDKVYIFLRVSSVDAAKLFKMVVDLIMKFNLKSEDIQIASTVRDFGPHIDIPGLAITIKP